MSDQGGVDAGWYPDPNDTGQRRYWDGQQWTDQTAPADDGDRGQGAAPTGAGAPSFPQGAGGGTLPKVDTWLWQSIVVTLLCCLPLGIAGIVFSMQAQSALNTGDVPLARQKAERARLMSLIGVGVGVVVIVLAFLVSF